MKVSDLRIVTFKLPVYILEEIDVLASKEGISRSEFIRRAIEYYISEYNKHVVRRGLNVKQVILQ